jgi:hypothetical protein
MGVIQAGQSQAFRLAFLGKHRSPAKRYTRTTTTINGTTEIISRNSFGVK